MSGSRMKEVRNELGLTQAQFAKLAGGRVSMISDYENGRRNIPEKLGLVIECFAEIHRLGGSIETVSNRAKAVRGGHLNSSQGSA